MRAQRNKDNLNIDRTPLLYCSFQGKWYFCPHLFCWSFFVLQSFPRIVPPTVSPKDFSKTRDLITSKLGVEDRYPGASALYACASVAYYLHITFSCCFLRT